MYRSALLILSGNMAGSLLLLVRNLAVARLVSVNDYGIASTFALAMAIVEMTSALGLQQQIVQHRNGDDPHLQAALQGFQLLRAIGNAALLFLLAGPIAAFFGIPDVAWAYRLMALVPLVNGFTHFDIYRLNRQLRHLPGVLSTLIAIAVSVALLWPLARLFGDYRMMLVAVLVQGAAAVVLSHLLAERRYRLTLDLRVMREGMRFGWPVLLNGMLLFAVFNGERLIVARELGMGALALFSLAFTLVLTPTLVMERSGQAFFLPQLAAARDGPAAAHGTLARAALQMHLMFGALTVAGVALLGPPVVQLLLGPRYAAALPLLGWLALLQGVRVAKGGSATVALAQGHSANGLVANLARVTLLPLAWAVLQAGGGMVEVVLIGLAAEVAGFALAFWLMRHRLRDRAGMALRRMVLPLALSVAVLALGALAAALRTGGGATLPAGWQAAGPLVLAGLPVLLCLLALSMTDLRRTLFPRRPAGRPAQEEGPPPRAP